MDKSKLKKLLKLVFQIAIAGVAIYFVLGEIDVEEYKSRLLGIDLLWLLMAIIAFNASKVLSAFRLNIFFTALGLKLQNNFNLKL
ncbi:MAG: uncharacterized membrane protein YbhN (UPF0104 family), partial [Roseivirga sp.]